MDKQRALQEKAKGNDAFAKKQWAIAVGHYTAAQMADPTEPTIPLNRAMAYLKLDKFQDAERDCTTALRLSPNNVKATFRRAKARAGAGRLSEAESDYQRVLVLDASNKEAQSELASVQKAIKEAKDKHRAPLDLSHLMSSSAAAKEDAQDVREEDREAPGAGNPSSVEAARKFLQQVGVQDPVAGLSPRKDGSSTNLPSLAPAKIPGRLPGETGGLLREVSTTRTSAASDQHRMASASVTVSSSTAPDTQQAHAHAYPDTLSGARETASALSFGGGSAGPSTSLQRRQSSQPPAAATRRLTAVEFQRRWKESSRPFHQGSSFSSAAKNTEVEEEQERAKQQLEFLKNVDPAALPALMDSLLEPDLLSSLLFSLETNVRLAASLGPEFDSSKRPIRLPAAMGTQGPLPDSNLLNVLKGFVVGVPRCKRFGMVVSMLDSTEKRAASTLIHVLEDNDVLEPAEIAAAHKVSSGSSPPSKAPELGTLQPGASEPNSAGGQTVTFLARTKPNTVPKSITQRSTTLPGPNPKQAYTMGVVFSCLAGTFGVLGEILQDICLALGEISAVLIRGSFGLLVTLCNVFAAVSCCWRVPWNERPHGRASVYDVELFAGVGGREVLSGVVTMEGRLQRRRALQAEAKDAALQGEGETEEKAKVEAAKGTAMKQDVRVDAADLNGKEEKGKADKALADADPAEKQAAKAADTAKTPSL